MGDVATFVKASLAMKSQNPGTVMVHKMFNQTILILWSYPQALVRAQAKQRASTPSRTLPNNMWDHNLLELTSNRSQPGFQLPLPSPLLHLRHNPSPWLGCHSAPSGQGGQNMQICKEQNAKCKMQNAKCKMQNANAFSPPAMVGNIPTAWRLSL